MSVLLEFIRLLCCLTYLSEIRLWSNTVLSDVANESVTHPEFCEGVKKVQLLLSVIQNYSSDSTRVIEQVLVLGAARS